MINLGDLTVIFGYLLSSFALGYCGSWLFYMFRRVAWISFIR